MLSVHDLASLFYYYYYCSHPGHTLYGYTQMVAQSQRPVLRLGRTPNGMGFKREKMVHVVWALDSWFVLGQYLSTALQDDYRPPCSF